MFGCSVTEPSNWLPYGTTKERGLTFLDKAGKELISSVFKHQSYFNLLSEKTLSEKNEIKELVYSSILEHYCIKADELTINVMED